MRKIFLCFLSVPQTHTHTHMYPFIQNHVMGDAVVVEWCWCCCGGSVVDGEYEIKH